MHNSIKILILSAFLCTLFACAPKSCVEYIDKSYNTDTVSVTLQIPQLKGIDDKTFTQSVNRELEDTCLQFLTKFKESAKNLSFPAVFTAETKEYETNGFLSIVTQLDYYTQKPHNNSFRITKNIDIKDNKCVLLKDIFEDDSYIDFINQSLLKIVTDNPDTYSDLWAKPLLSENQEYYISDGNLIVYYPPYELSYYSRGFVEFPIPLTELSGYMKDDYRRMLIKSPQSLQ